MRHSAALATVGSSPNVRPLDANIRKLRQRAGDEPSPIVIGSARQPDWRFVPWRQSRRFRPRDEGEFLDLDASGSQIGNH